MSNKGQAYAFRSEVLLLLHEHGFHGARKPDEPKGVPAAQKVHGDIVGLPFTIAVRSSATLDLSGSLTEARREAQAEDTDVYVSVHKRRGHPVEDSYVVTDLATWARVLARLHPECRFE